MVVEEAENIASQIDEKEAAKDAEAYRVGYCKLFNGIGEIIKNAHTHKQAIEALKYLQMRAEEHFIECGED